MRLMLLASLMNPAALAGDFDPTAYLQQKTVAAPAEGVTAAKLSQSEVKIKGRRYRVLRSPVGSLYLPVVTAVSKDDLDRGLCDNQLPYELEKCQPEDNACFQRNHDHMTEEVTVLHAETPLTGSLVAYAELVGETIKRKCGDINATYFVGTKFRPEIGVSWKGGTERDPTTYKVFNSMTKGLGFRSEF